jgi:predicted Rossmann fold flavoprotein
LEFDIIIIGGGAAGFFTAINVVEKNPQLKVAILERGKDCLTKVKISGGGRCNVTHACFVPNDLVKYYPRGERELKGPFNQFCTGDTIEWFEKRGVELKIEDDGRMFPITDSSQTIIDCFEAEVKKLGIKIFTSTSVQNIFFNKDDKWKLETPNDFYIAEKLVIATGSNPKIWEMLENLGHSIESPVPSLFTFNISDKRIKDLMGLSANATVKVKNSKLEASGPLLITHWGLSGPGILRLSAWGAKELHDKKYCFALQVNFLDDLNFDEAIEKLKDVKEENNKKLIGKFCPFDFPKRLWENLVLAADIALDYKWAEVNKKQLTSLANQLTRAEFQVNGKSTFKEEFVTAGGVQLKEINFKTMQSKILRNVYFAGEVVNIDAITGGFNFQNAWTSGFIVAENIV